MFPSFHWIQGATRQRCRSVIPIRAAPQRVWGWLAPCRSYLPQEEELVQMPSPGLSFSYTLGHLLSLALVQRGRDRFSNFTVEDTEAQRCQTTLQGHTAGKLSLVTWRKIQLWAINLIFSPLWVSTLGRPFPFIHLLFIVIWFLTGCSRSSVNHYRNA